MVKRVFGLWKVYLIPVLLAAVLLGGCGSSSGKSGRAPKGTKEYVLSDYFGTREAGEDYIRKSENNGLCEKAELDRDGRIHIYATDDQADFWRKNSKESLDEIEDSSGNGNISYDFNKKYTKFTITAPKGCDIKKLATVFHQGVFAAEIYQVFNGNEDWSLQVVLINEDNGKTILKTTMPENMPTFDKELWD